MSLALESFRAWDLAPSARDRLPGLVARIRTALSATHVALLWEERFGHAEAEVIALSPLGDWWRAIDPKLSQSAAHWSASIDVPVHGQAPRRGQLVALGASDLESAEQSPLVGLLLRNVQAELSCLLLETELDRRPERRLDAHFAEIERTSLALRASERRLRTIVEHAPVGIALVTEGLTWQRSNDQLCRLLGCRPSDILGADFESIFLPEDWADLEPMLRQVQRGELDCLRSEKCLRRLQEPGIWCAITVSLVEPGSSDGKLVVIVDDISERYEFRQRLLQQTRHKDEFLAMLGHELRNPLSAIQNATKLLQAKDLSGDDSLIRISKVLDRQSAQMRRMVGDLLDVSRIAAGKVQLRLEDVELGALVREVAEDMSARFARKQLTLLAAPCDEPVWVRGDRVRLTQIIQNLLDNAAKFTDVRGTVMLGLSPGNGNVALRVRDTGIGMDAHMLELAFDTFRQADRSLERTRGGLGLGLALVRGLVDLHGGAVEACSEGLGRGTEIVVLLPRGEAPLPKALARPIQRPIEGFRILIVEDNQDSADTLRELLETRAFDVSVAYDAEAAQETVRKRAPELVLCDIGLPRVSGFQLAKALRLEHGDAFRLVALTGYGGEGEREQAMAAGFDAHLTKPLELERFEALVHSFASAVQGEVEHAADVHPREC